MELKDWNMGVMLKRTSRAFLEDALSHREKGQPEQTRLHVQRRPKLTSSLPPSVVTVDSTYPVSPLSDPENVSHGG